MRARRSAVPKPGKETRLVQPLAIAMDLARVKLSSEPPGAQVVQNGQRLAGVATPTDVLVEAGKPVSSRSCLRGYVPATLEPITPERRGELARDVKLVPGVTVDVMATLEGKATVTGAAAHQAL